MSSFSAFRFFMMVLLTAIPSLAVAQDMQDEAFVFIETFGNQALDFLQDTDLQDADLEKVKDHSKNPLEGRFRLLLQANFDIPTIGRFVLGRHWRVATNQQQEEYLSLFEEMIVKTYTDRLQEYSGETLKLIKSRTVGRRDVVVSSVIKRPNGPDIQVEWRVRKKSGQYRIIDVIVEGISMSVTQRSEFHTLIENGNGKIDVLLVALQESADKKITVSEKK